MMNSIRYETTASLLDKGEAQETQVGLKRAWLKLRQLSVLTANARKGLSGMVGDRMIGSWSDVKWGTRTVQERLNLDWKQFEARNTGGVRVLVGAKKSRNGDGAKGDREVEA